MAFSVAEGDTTSRLLSIVKGHEAHPNTLKMITNAIDIAIEKCNMPKGVFTNSRRQKICWRVSCKTPKDKNCWIYRFF